MIMGVSESTISIAFVLRVYADLLQWEKCFGVRISEWYMGAFSRETYPSPSCSPSAMIPCNWGAYVRMVRGRILVLNAYFPARGQGQQGLPNSMGMASSSNLTTTICSTRYNDVVGCGNFSSRSENVVLRWRENGFQACCGGRVYTQQARSERGQPQGLHNRFGIDCTSHLVAYITHAVAQAACRYQHPGESLPGGPFLWILLPPSGRRLELSAFLPCSSPNARQ